MNCCAFDRIYSSCFAVFLKFHVTYPRASEFPVGAKNIKVYKVKLTKVAEINPEYVSKTPSDMHFVNKP